LVAIVQGALVPALIPLLLSYLLTDLGESRGCHRAIVDGITVEREGRRTVV